MKIRNKTQFWLKFPEKCNFCDNYGRNIIDNKTFCLYHYFDFIQSRIDLELNKRIGIKECKQSEKEVKSK